MTGPAATAVARLADNARTERADLDAVLDAGLVAHVGILDSGGFPVVLPMGYARDTDRLLLHGSTGSRLMRSLAAGAPLCATVTLLDGLVYARSAFESSMHYRSATVFGRGAALTGEEHLAGLRRLTEHLLPGRWEQLRAPTRKELAATLVVAVALDTWSVKVSDGPPEDPDSDLGLPVWAGVVPLVLARRTAVDAPDLAADHRPAADVGAGYPVLG